MSPLGLGIILIFSGTIALAIRLFLFLDVKEVDKNNIKNIRLNSLILITIGILNFSIGAILILIFHSYYSNSLDILIKDFNRSRNFFAAFFIILGLLVFLFKERIFKDWDKDGFKIPFKRTNEKKVTLLLILILLITGLLFHFL